jgi:hypothetical protein
MTHLFPHKTHRCPILCLMYTHPRQLSPKLDIASHKRDAFFFSSSGSSLILIWGCSVARVRCF